ncbi:response regulator [Methylobacter sp. G7]|uniref:response regulator n=1 Tax=Methylobacter sp. G7 TaxID=3230117 RepID=UPI003D806750
MNSQSISLKIKVLIVDDNRIIRHLLRLTFSDSRIELFEADCCETALSIITDQKPDYVILDVMIPGELNGFQVCQKVKSWSDTRQCKIILLTARSQQQDFDLGKQVGADFYMTKPFSPTELLALIDFEKTET